jgi:2-C-methyl-D-erythritol 4-phosphate cytidylyltransferase
MNDLVPTLETEIDRPDPLVNLLCRAAGEGSRFRVPHTSSTLALKGNPVYVHSIALFAGCIATIAQE